MTVTLTRVPHGGADWREAVALRQAVLRLPLGLWLDPAELATEADQIHLLLRVDGIAAGAAIVVPPPPGETEAKIRQMAVAARHAGRGYGRMLLEAAERDARSAGAITARLHARCSAEGFYRRLGWWSVGRPFAEIGLPHVLMRRDLPAAPAA